MSHPSIQMLDYYCQHKSTKDIAIAFYHTAKQHQTIYTNSTIHDIQSRFQSYFSKIDINTLNRQEKQVIKATSVIIQKHKTTIKIQKSIDDRELESAILTPRESLRLEINSSKYINREGNQQSKNSDIFKTSWNQESAYKNNDSKVRTLKFDNSRSGLSEFLGKELPAHAQSKTEIDRLYTQLLQEYKIHKIDLAYETSQKIQKLIKNNSPSKPKAEIMSMIEQIQHQYTEMNNYYKQFDEPGWEFDNTTHNISLYSKTINGGQHVAVLITAQLNIPLLNFLVMTQQIDLFNKFVPFCGKGDQIKRVDRNLYIGRSTVDMPLFTDRQTYFYAKMIDRIQKTGSIFFYSKSINNNPEACKKYGVNIPEKSKYIKLQYNFFIVQCKILAKDKIHIRMASSVDMKMNFLPNFILMMSARKFALQYFMNILREQKKFSESIWSNRIRQKPVIYGYFQSIIDQYLARKQ